MTNLHSTLLAFSEWLDGQGLIVGDDESEDQRTHDDLAAEFIRERDAR